MSSSSHQTYTEVIIYDRLTSDQYGTLSQQQVHVPSEGDIISLGSITADREPGEEEYKITDRDSQNYLVTGVNFDYNAVEYRTAGEAEGTQLIEQIWIAVEPARTTTVE